jgi:hypothetical protein
MVVGRRGTATRIRRAYAMVGRLRRRYAIDGVMWFDWRDYRPSPGDFRGDTWGFHTGLLTAGGLRKPAYGALRRAIRRLG